jgi:hypothetical protein
VEEPDKKLRWLRIVAQNAPAGYRDTQLLEYGIDFERQRRLESSRVEEARFKAKMEADLAQAEKDREEQRKAFLRGVKITQ